MPKQFSTDTDDDNWNIGTCGAKGWLSLALWSIMGAATLYGLIWLFAAVLG